MKADSRKGAGFCVFRGSAQGGPQTPPVHVPNPATLQSVSMVQPQAPAVVTPQREPNGLSLGAVQSESIVQVVQPDAATHTGFVASKWQSSFVEQGPHMLPLHTGFAGSRASHCVFDE